MNLKVTDESLTLADWLAGRIKIDVLEKYGIEIEVKVDNPENHERVPQRIVPNPTEDEIAHLDRMKDVLEPKHIQAFLGMSQRKTYECDAPFRVLRVGRTLKIPKSSFSAWFLGQNKNAGSTADAR